MKNLYSALAIGVVAASLSATNAHAQVNFRSGYIVRLAGDTVRGEVDYRDAHRSAQQCQFRPSAEAATTLYKPAELRAYGFVGDSRRLYRTQTLPGPVAVPGTEPQYFLEVLVNGPANLYTWSDADRADHYYVATSTFPLTELVHRKVLLEEQRMMQEQNTYRNTLAQALAGCPAAQAQLPSLSYMTPALVRVVQAYNACQGVQAPATPIMADKQYHARVGLLLGYQSVSMHLRQGATGAPNPAMSLDMGPKYTPAIGLSLNLPIPLLSHKLSLETELFYESEAYEGDFIESANSFPTNRHATFNMAYLRLPLLLRYTLPRGSVRPFLEVGPTIAYAVRMDTKQTITDYYGHVTGPTDYLADTRRSWQQGLAGGVGVQFKYWQSRPATLLVRYEGNTGWVDGVAITSWTNRALAILTFAINK